jgi:hypothetical protein
MFADGSPYFFYGIAGSGFDDVHAGLKTCANTEGKLLGGGNSIRIAWDPYRSSPATLVERIKSFDLHTSEGYRCFDSAVGV